MASRGEPVVASTADPVERPSLVARLSNSFTLIILLAIVVVFSILRGGTFLSVTNFNNTLVDTAQLLLLTIGVTFVIITAGIDLSISSILILSAVVASGCATCGGRAASFQEGRRAYS